MKSAVITFPGSNREGDVIRALRQASGVEPVKIWHQDQDLPHGTDLVVLPGGFSYGDYLRCGAIASRSPVMDAVRSHAAKGGLVLGICNGFQILVESGLLPGVLMRNAGLKFICKMQYLKVCRANTPFTSAYKKNQIIKVRSRMVKAIMLPMMRQLKNSKLKIGWRSVIVMKQAIRKRETRTDRSIRLPGFIRKNSMCSA